MNKINTRLSQYPSDADQRERQEDETENERHEEARANLVLEHSARTAVARATQEAVKDVVHCCEHHEALCARNRGEIRMPAESIQPYIKFSIFLILNTPP